MNIRMRKAMFHSKHKLKGEDCWKMLYDKHLTSLSCHYFCQSLLQGLFCNLQKSVFFFLSNVKIKIKNKIFYKKIQICKWIKYQTICLKYSLLVYFPAKQVTPPTMNPITLITLALSS